MKLIPLLLIVFAVLTRLLPHPPNFAPITALALFGGVYLEKKYAFILPLAALFLSDLFIGFYGFTMFFVYGSFLLNSILGLWLRKNKSLYAIFGTSIIASVIFFIITNFGVWLDPVSFYPKNFSGLLESYVLAIPFFRGTILGDLYYTGVLFGAYELGRLLLKRFIPSKIFSFLY